MVDIKVLLVANITLLLIAFPEALTLTAHSVPTGTDAEPSYIFVSVDTRVGDAVIDKWGLPQTVTNLGRGAPWRGYASKPELLLNFTRAQPRDQIIVYADSHDVRWGGCSRQQFGHSYREIVSASGATIVASAELVCGEQECDSVVDVPEWAVKHSGINDLSTGYMTQFAVCDKDPKMCSCDHGWISSMNIEDCSPHMPLKYLNSGFIMGPAGDVSDMLAWGLKNAPPCDEADDVCESGRTSDQGSIAAYWMKFPTKVTLDYTGELCTTTMRLAPRALVPSPSQTNSGMVVRNRMFRGRVQCFVHNNEYHGSAKEDWFEVLARVTAGPTEWNDLQQ